MKSTSPIVFVHDSIHRLTSAICKKLRHDIDSPLIYVVFYGRWSSVEETMDVKEIAYEVSNLFLLFLLYFQTSILDRHVDYTFSKLVGLVFVVSVLCFIYFSNTSFRSIMSLFLFSLTFSFYVSILFCFTLNMSEPSVMCITSCFT